MIYSEQIMVGYHTVERKNLLQGTSGGERWWLRTTMSFGRFLREAWHSVTPAANGQREWKGREVCPRDSAGVTEKGYYSS